MHDESVWFDLLQFVALHLPQGVLFTVDLLDFRQLVLDTPKSADLYVQTRLNSSRCIPPTLASAILHHDTQLAVLRFNLVPNTLQEQTFWQIYTHHLLETCSPQTIIIPQSPVASAG